MPGFLRARFKAAMITARMDSFNASVIVFLSNQPSKLTVESKNLAKNTTCWPLSNETRPINSLNNPIALKPVAMFEFFWALGILLHR